MPSLHPTLRALLERDASQIAFLLDFDGTMVDLVNDPDGVTVPDTLIDDLKTIVAERRYVCAIATGRAVAKIDHFLKGLKMPIVGNHGAEMRLTPDSSIQRVAFPVPMDIRLSLQSVCKQHNGIFDDKVYSVSIHLPFRDADKDITATIKKALDHAENEYVVRKAGRTHEILQKGLGKGPGIAHLMQQAGFDGLTPIYVGDDVDTDTSLSAVREMGGTLVPVLHTYDLSAKPTRPDQVLVADVCAFVATLAGRAACDTTAA